MRIVKNIFKKKSHRPKADGTFFSKLSLALGFRPHHIPYYEKAFTHRSMNLKDDKGNALSYERLEFLGDAMLGAVIADYLFQEVPQGDEGYLTKMRSKIVSREHLNEVGKELGLIDFIKSKIPKKQFGENVHGNMFEALIGAIFLDKGFSVCKDFIYQRIINPHVDIERLENKVISYKSLLIEWCQKEKKSFYYDVFEDTGNDHTRHFSVKLSINGKVVSKARATSKKKAEEKASQRAYYTFQKQIDHFLTH